MGNRKPAYIVAEAGTAEELADAVNKLTADGMYKPIGGIAVGADHEGLIFVQALGKAIDDESHAKRYKGTTPGRR